MHFRTRAIHVGNEHDPATGAVVRPIHLAATYVQPGAGEWGEFDYSRSGNPTRKALETTLASLESGVGALAFSSGMAATHCVTMLFSSGDHILAGTDIYGGTYRLLHKIVNRSGIQVSLAPSTDLAALEAAIRPETKLLWIESPGTRYSRSPTLPPARRLPIGMEFLGRGRNLRHAGAYPAAGIGSRYRRAFGHQVHWGTATCWAAFWRSTTGNFSIVSTLSRMPPA